jgi:trigger factor
MKVDVEDISTVKKVLNVEIPEAEVTRELDKAFGALQKNARIKGFRPGKVPLSILEQRFKKDVHAEVSGQLIQNSYTEALRETQLVPLSDPTVVPPELEKGQAYRYAATIEVRPPMEDLNVKGLKLVRKVYTVDDEEIEAHLKMLQKGQAQLKSIEEDRPVKTGDYVLVDYEGFKDGQPFEPAGKTENFGVEVGSGKILKEFDDELVGMRRDTSKEFTVHFPDDYFSKELAGLEVTFKVTLNDIKEEVLPDLDDEFAKDLGEDGTLEGLKEMIRTDLEGKYQDVSERGVRRHILDQLIEQQEFELPEVLIEHELSALVSEAQNMLRYRGLSPEEEGQTEEVLSKKYRSLAERRVKEYLLLQKAADQEGITATDEVLEESYKRMSTRMNQPVETLKQFHNAYKEAFEAFKQKALEEEAIQLIISNGSIETVEGDKQEALRAVTGEPDSEGEPKTDQDDQGDE